MGGKVNSAGDEVSWIHLARFAAAGLGNGDRSDSRPGCADGIPASFRDGAGVAVSLAFAGSFRHRSKQVAPDVRSLEELYAAGPESAGHSGFRDGQCGRDRLERPACERRDHSWNLFRDRLHRDNFTGSESYVRNAGRSALVVEIYHLIFHALLV